MTAEELYGLLQARMPGGFYQWHGQWWKVSPACQKALQEVADTISERQAERVYEATAGEDI